MVKKTSSAVLTIPATQKSRAEMATIPAQNRRGPRHRDRSSRRRVRRMTSSASMSSTQANAASSTWRAAYFGK